MPDIVNAGADYSAVAVAFRPPTPFADLGGALYASYLLGSGYALGSPLTDYSGHGRDLVAVGAPTVAATHTTCGTGNYFNCPFHASDIGAGHGAVTILVAAQDSQTPGSTAPGTQFVSSNNASGPASIGIVAAHAANLTAYLKTPTTISANLSITADTHWKNFPEICGGVFAADLLKTHRFYTGLGLVSSAPVVAGLINPATMNADVMHIGAIPGVTGSNVDVFAVGIWNRKLTDAEVAKACVRLAGYLGNRGTTI